ncbi:uncharacterized protein LOC127832106 [Dreissena polymorpha]|uniref:uncharacterized protein LOC127832106 n=1 Tax=Dreissena polymorpha TaxID=45954 RepID=UPI0022648D0B|nr:uncharacterized protein LOC127832106 [Dreissena polymorpha]
MIFQQPKSGAAQPNDANLALGNLFTSLGFTSPQLSQNFGNLQGDGRPSPALPSNQFSVFLGQTPDVNAGTMLNLGGLLQPMIGGAQVQSFSLPVEQAADIKSSIGQRTQNDVRNNQAGITSQLPDSTALNIEIARRSNNAIRTNADAGAPNMRFGNIFGSGFTSNTDRNSVGVDSGRPRTSSNTGDAAQSSLPGINVGSGPRVSLTPTTSAPPKTPSIPRQSATPADTLTCTAEYRRLPGHTLCLKDNRDVTKSGVNIQDRQFITQFHNDLRANVQPPAADLMKLQWDDRLAAVAQKWAKQCVLAHDDERKIPELGLTVGQNVAVGFESWQEAIRMWYDEISMYRYGFEPDSYLGPEGWRQIAHFTQIVQNGTFLVGCGYAECPNTKYIRFFVCNYASGQSNLAYPYTAGSRCEVCPHNCNNGLCDCNGLICLNKGRLNPGACKCECPKPYTGEQCERVDCPARDAWVCGRDWPASYCNLFYNVPEECPHMCGLCPGFGNGGSKGGFPSVTTAVNVTVFTSSHGCRYEGARDDVATCRAYGDKGNDMKMCASEGGAVGCDDCTRYFNIKKDYCPVMCGLCDPPCSGKRCLNGGSLDTTSCSCMCKKPFTGDNCEFAQCPNEGDPGHCRFWNPGFCRKYTNVPEECPYMCGICKAEGAVTRTGKTKTHMSEPNEA